MKQGRLSFSTKRKDREEAKVADVVVIGDSPEKPPPKKICRDSIVDLQKNVEEKTTLGNAAELRTEPPEGQSNSLEKAGESKTETPKNSIASDKNLTENFVSSTDDNDNVLEKEDSEDAAEKDEELSDAADQERNGNADTEAKDVIEDGGEEPMETSIAESSILDSTVESVPDEHDSNEKSDSSTSTAPKRARLSKTEAAYRSLKQRKDKELRQKEKDEKLKQKQEEKERREQEKKELRDRKEKERLEREKKKEEERLERERKKEEERLERERKKEEERLERERKKEEERLEKEKKKEEERQLKEKERLEKEREREEKEKIRKEKEEERRRREEDKKRELEEESAKKEKAKQAFMSFFVKKPPSTTTSLDTNSKTPTAAGDECNASDDDIHRGENTAQIKFKPFQLKKDMKLAPIVSEDARNRFDKFALETKLGEQSATVGDLYIQQLKQGYRPLLCGKKKPENPEAEDQDVIVITRLNEASDESSGGRMRAKLLQFRENYRPAYYGTWRKKCPQINGRKLFNKYNDFDYTVDSDDEWEEGEGESLAGTDDEKEEKDEVEEDYEEDDFLVPHGYLSESEEDEEDDQPMDPEALKARIAARQEEFKADRKAGLQKKKVVAVCALGPDGVCLQEEIKVLSQFKAVLMVATGLKPSWERENEFVINSKDAEPAVLTGKALELFCNTAHGAQGGARSLYDTFLQKWRAVSDVRINHKSLKMTLTMCCKKSKSLNALVVNSQLVEKFGLQNLEADTANDGTPTSSKFLPNDVIPELIKVTQGNSKTSQILEEFLAKNPSRKFGKAQVKRTLANIGEFDHVQRCWLVKDECLKEHGLEELRIEKVSKKDVKDEKTIKTKDLIKSKDERKSKDAGDDLKSSNKENDDSKDSKTSVESPKTDKASSANTENTTPRRVSIKSFFTAKSSATTPTSSRVSSSSTPKNLASTEPEKTNVVTTPVVKPLLTGTLPQALTRETPKAKKRVQLTTLSRTPTLKEEKRPQAVLDKDETIIIDESN